MQDKHQLYLHIIQVQLNLYFFGNYVKILNSIEKIHRFKFVIWFVY